MPKIRVNEAKGYRVNLVLIVVSDRQTFSLQQKKANILLGGILVESLQLS